MKGQGLLILNIALHKANCACGVYTESQICSLTIITKADLEVFKKTNPVNNNLCWGFLLTDDNRQDTLSNNPENMPTFVLIA